MKQDFSDWTTEQLLEYRPKIDKKVDDSLAAKAFMCNAAYIRMLTDIDVELGSRGIQIKEVRA